MKILVVNGPNLDRLGARQPEIYGTTTLADLEASLKAKAEAAGHSIAFVQDADAEKIAAAIEQTDADAVILNPASLTHHARRLTEVVRSCGKPVIEVHISNIAAREPYRRRSMVSVAATGSIVGLGVNGYLLALDHLISEASP